MSRDDAAQQAAQAAQQQLEQCCKDRTNQKRAITIQCKLVDRMVAEQNKADASAAIKKLKGLFATFEQVHDKIGLAIEDDYDEHDQYHDVVYQRYMGSLKAATQFVDGGKCTSNASSAGAVGSTADSSVDDSATKIARLLQLPDIKVKPFDGKPKEYLSFMDMFKETVEDVAYNDSQRLTRLLQLTKGPAYDAIHKLEFDRGPGSYKRAKEILHNRFGRKHLIGHHVVSDLKCMPNAKSGHALQSLADEIDNAACVMKKLDLLNEIDNNTVIKCIVEKLPIYAQNKWRKRATQMMRQKGAYPNFDSLVNFVGELADTANDPVYGVSSSSSSSSKVFSAASLTEDSCEVSDNECKLTEPTVQKTKPKSKKNPQCPLCADGLCHKLYYCPKFKAMSVDDRKQHVQKNKLCENCFWKHSVDDCKVNCVCNFPGCGLKHNRMLHVQTVQTLHCVANTVDIDSTLSNTNASTANNSAISKNDISSVASLNTDVAKPFVSKIFMPIVQVNVNDSMLVNCLLDSASTSSFICAEIVSKLQLKPRKISHQLSTLSGTASRLCDVVDIKISATDDSHVMHIKNVYVIDHIPVDVPCFADCSKYAHLSDIRWPVMHNNNVSLLLGQDCSDALIPVTVRVGNRDEPFATKTMFGWSLNGCVPDGGRHKETKAICNFILTADVEKSITKLWEIEDDHKDLSPNTLSADDERVLSMWNTKYKHTDGHYVLPVPWKSNDIILPNNLAMAVSRLRSTQRSLVKKGIYNEYNDEVQALLANNYAERVSIDEVSSKKWYLPHHAVPKKGGKIRLVFDCAASFNGMSLNSCCLRGPDLINKLFDVLLQFRQHVYAVMGDIKAMYLQVKIDEGDRDSFRFLWYDKDESIIEYRMTSFVFGAIFSGSAASYALRKCVENGQYPLAKSIVEKSIYVDDMLRCEPSIDQLKQAVSQTKEALSAGGFHLTKFISNSPAMMNDIPLEDQAKEAKVLQQPPVTPCALGIRWSHRSDHFYFITEPFVAAITKRTILSFVSSIFDPLGFICPVALIPKLIMQSLYRMKLDWDDEIPEDLDKQWQSWL